MSFTLKDIKGAPKDVNLLQYTHYERGEQCLTPKDCIRLNNDITNLYNVKLRFNRDKIQRIIYDYCFGRKKDEISYYDLTDAIIAAEKEIVEVES